MTRKTRCALTISGRLPIGPEQILQHLENWAFLAEAVEEKMCLTPNECVVWILHITVFEKTPSILCADAAYLYDIKGRQKSSVGSNIHIPEHEDPHSLAGCATFIVETLRKTPLKKKKPRKALVPVS